MDPEGPLSIRWSYLPRLVPWLARYVHAGYFQDVDHTARALQVLCDPTVELFKKLVEEAGRPDLVRDSDYIWAYRTEKGFRDARPDVEARRRHGVHIAELDAVELHEREPALAADFRWGYISSPSIPRTWSKPWPTFSGARAGGSRWPMCAMSTSPPTEW